MKFIVYKHSGILSLLWTLVIFILCATPGQYIPSNNWLDLLSVDKLVHAFIFWLLSVLLIMFAVRKMYSTWVYTSFFVLCVCYGVALELMQAYVFTNRSADWQDAVANTTGCIIALFFVTKIKKLKTQITNPQ